jgi:hypothetical protein
MFGAGIGLASLTFAIFYEGILRRKLTNKITKGITRSALVGISLMFILPQVLHYLASTYLEKDRYVICDEMSYQWLLYKKIVYTTNQLRCETLIQEKEIIGYPKVSNLQPPQHPACPFNLNRVQGVSLRMVKLLLI